MGDISHADETDQCITKTDANGAFMIERIQYQVLFFSQDQIQDGSHWTTRLPGQLPETSRMMGSRISLVVYDTNI